MTQRAFEDFKPGEVFPLAAVTVTEADIIAFASVYDPQPFHLDEAAGRASLLGGLAASGWHTLSIAMRLLAEGVLNDSFSMGSPGLDRISWRAPVRPGDVLTGTCTIREVRPSRSRPEMGFVLVAVVLVNQTDETVIEMIGPVMIGRRVAAVLEMPDTPEAGR
ncbi:MaoC family dehydratase [Segnochrobactraceae bacterium EtOH-i3]